MKFKSGLPQKYIESLRSQKAKPVAKTKAIVSHTTQSIEQKPPVAAQAQIEIPAKVAGAPTEQSESGSNINKATSGVNQATTPLPAKAPPKKENDIQASLF